MRTRQGEVDLIARRRGLIAFIEVKTRAKAADLAFAVDEYRLRRVAAAAKSLMPRYQRPGEDVRIDVILLAPWTWPRHIEGAWEEVWRA
jgi:putative endonuclease